MYTLFTILVLLTLALITIQDFRFRAVSWYLFPLGIIALLFWNYSQSSFGEMVSYQLLNLALLSFQLAILVLFFRLKGIRVTELMKSFIGLGDILFFVLLALGLPSLIFIGFFLFSLVVSLLAGQLFFRKSTTPLAGIQAALLFLFICLDMTGLVNLHHLNNIQI